uniref:hypothetical protein n=1 Tax=Limnohabitans sp. TaxID=1907725 RepID=UPI0040474FE4
LFHRSMMLDGTYTKHTGAGLLQSFLKRRNQTIKLLLDFCHRNSRDIAESVPDGMSFSCCS